MKKILLSLFALLFLAFVLLDAEKFGGGEVFGLACSYTLIVLVAVVFYMLAGIILKDVSGGRDVLPMGKPLV